ncbi:MAG: VanZ like family protein [Bacteroidetes bacterium ADurb.BinA104]|nr:MAG: VanZ like family protein [Bacteroidetes bacterium ADurb.BinA104]
MFIPLGYFLSSAFFNSKHPRLCTLLSALFVSVSIELLQFFTYRGMLDVDDLVSNVCGAVLGLLIYRLLCKVDKQRWTTGVMLIAGFVGCIITAIPAAKSSIDVKVTKEFAFSISSVEVDNGKTVIEGECFLYDRKTPSYTILIDGMEVTTDMDGQVFRAEASRIDHKAEVQVKFRGFPATPTGVWIKPTASGVEVEYVAGEAPVIPDLPRTAVLKAWNTENDTLVYQDGERLLWLIGKEIDKNTEVIYHIHTDEPEKLPERRVQYGFDNRGFRVGTERAENEVSSIDHYRVFEKEIPQEYNVTAVVVGFNTDGTITWSDSFRIE